MSAIDLNAKRIQRAAAREAQGMTGGTVPVHVGDKTFHLPPELPATIVTYLLDPDVEIAQVLMILVRTLQAQLRAGQNERAADAMDLFLDALVENKQLPVGLIRALYNVAKELFGEQAWAEFKAGNPSVDDEIELFKGLLKSYGARLGELFASSAPASSGGATSSAISSVSTASTPAASGFPQVTPISSVSAG